MPKTETKNAITAAAERVVAAIEEMGLPAAKASWSHETADGFWSIVTKRSGASLTVNASRNPSCFAALKHAKPQMNVSLKGVEKGDERLVLRDAAALLTLPADARAIPFTLITTGTSTDVCGVAFSKPVRAQIAVLVGHGYDGPAPLQANVIGEDEVALVGLDGHSDRFGAVTFRSELTKLKGIDLDQRSLSFLTPKPLFTILASEVEKGPQSAVEAQAKKLGIPFRRMVEVEPGTWSFR